MNYFNNYNFHTGRKQYDSIREFCRCEKIDEEYFRRALSEKESGNNTILLKLCYLISLLFNL
ncbi:MAG TPA: hypothetical protein GXX49_02035 [Clostridiaceae bacterium]|nr:hypothetical protein [Clostridiaceae bacterium]